MLQTDHHTKKNTDHTTRQQNADRVEITFYTDPLCCWSWAFEPQWRRLQYEFAGQISWRYCMGGLLPGWNNFNDPTNNVSRPIQMGPVWMHAAQISGMQMNTRIWMEDPPASSYPACIAVKCAMLQSGEAGEVYLRLLREAIMLHGKNIAKQQVLNEIAEALSASQPALFSIEPFYAALQQENGLEAFRRDINEVQTRNINRFPTLILRAPNQQAIMMTGYRPYTALLEALQQVAPTIERTNAAISSEDYEKHWATITRREVDEIIAK
jgi:putative protein-disulfide isomerase